MTISIYFIYIGTRKAGKRLYIKGLARFISGKQAWKWKAVESSQALDLYGFI